MGRAEQKATIVGALTGGLAGAFVLWEAVGALYLRYMALVMGIGPGSRTRGVVAFLLFAAVFGAVFGAMVSRYGGGIASALMGVARSNSVTRSIFGPFFRRGPLTTTATIVGAVYGLLLGSIVGQFVVPALVVGATPFTYELARSDPGVLYGFAAYGAMMGFGYGATREELFPSVGMGDGRLVSNGTKALFLGPLVGGAAGASAFYVLVPGHLASLALIAGLRPTPGRVVGVFLLLSLWLSLLFIFTAARTVSRDSGYVGGVTSAGFAYGVVLAVGLGMLAVPHYATKLTEWSISVPNANLSIILGYIVFGTSLGAAYGSVRQHGHLLPEVVREHRDAVVFSALVGGFVGGGIVYQAAGYAQMLFYGSLVGVEGSVPKSWAVWMVTTFLLALFYVRFIRPRDTSGAYVWKSARRGTIFGFIAGIVIGTILVPSIVDGTTRFTMPVPYLNPMIILAYTVFGGIVGAGYGGSVQEEGLAAAADRTQGVLFGSALGGLTGGLIIHNFTGPLHIQLVGSFGGVAGSLAKSWAVWMLFCLAFGIGFAQLVSRSLDAYADSLHETASANPDLRAMLKPWLDRAPLTTTATGLGMAYGAALGIVVGLLLVPMVVTLTHPVYQLHYPRLDLSVFLGYTVFGALLGAGYGSMVEF